MIPYNYIWLITILSNIIKSKNKQSGDQKMGDESEHNTNVSIRMLRSSLRRHKGLFLSMIIPAISGIISMTTFVFAKFNTLENRIITLELEVKNNKESTKGLRETMGKLWAKYGEAHTRMTDIDVHIKSCQKAFDMVTKNTFDLYDPNDIIRKEVIEAAMDDVEEQVRKHAPKYGQFPEQKQLEQQRLQDN
jgi:hypothetical protein